MHNASPIRFQTTADLQKYMKGIFDVLYTLDLAEADVVLEKGPNFIAEYYKKLDSEPGRGTTARTDEVRSLNGNSNGLRLNNLDGLIESHIVGPSVPALSYGNDNYYNVDMFVSHYGINENSTGASGGLTFRRVAFELLAEKGYYNGMVPYISSQYYTERGIDEDVESKSDTYILKRIFNGEYKSFKEFRKAMFQRRADKKDDLISVQTWDARERWAQINSYDDIKRLIKEAVNIAARTGKWDAVTKVKRNIYHAYLVATDEFRNSIYKSGDN